jgi:hypothetical protein
VRSSGDASPLRVPTTFAIGEDAGFVRRKASDRAAATPTLRTVGIEPTNGWFRVSAAVGPVRGELVRALHVSVHSETLAPRGCRQTFIERDETQGRRDALGSYDCGCKL